MPKCENFYHCNKASSGGLTLNKGGFDVRVISEAGTFNVVINQKIDSVAGPNTFEIFKMYKTKNIHCFRQKCARPGKRRIQRGL